jgi:hypothetical protein
MPKRDVSPLLRDIIRHELESKKKLREDLGRGIPDFAVTEIARETVEATKRRIIVHINQTAQDPKRRRELTAEAALTLRELEEEIAELLRTKLGLYIRNT